MEPVSKKDQYTPIEKNKIRLYYFLGSGSAIVLLAVFIFVVHIRGLHQEYQKKINQLSAAIISEKKHFLENAVSRTIYMIESERDYTKRVFSSRKLSQNQIDRISIKRISNSIRDLRLIDDGYVWVNRIIDYQGGERYAIRQIHPNLPHTEGEYLSTKATDIKGNTPYLTELEGVRTKGEIFFDYYFKKMDSEKIAHKLTYAKLYKPWNWVVATGVYLDDVDELVHIETGKMRETLINQIIYTFIVVVFVFILSIVILVSFEKKIRNLILAYEDRIRIYTERLIGEKLKTEKALAEVDQLKGLLPICSSCKNVRDDSGYWSQIESYISAHSKAEFTHSLCPDCAKKLYPDIFDEEKKITGNNT